MPRVYSLRLTLGWLFYVNWGTYPQKCCAVETCATQLVDKMNYLAVHLRENKAEIDNLRWSIGLLLVRLTSSRDGGCDFYNGFRIDCGG